MHTHVIDLQEHADRWPELTIKARYAKDALDLTIATHPDFGLCLIEGNAWQSIAVWHTDRPMKRAQTA